MVVAFERRKQHLSQEALAGRAAVHRTHLSDIEAGKVRVSLDVAKRVADALGVPLSALLERTERLAE